MKKSTNKNNMFNFVDGEIFAVPATKDFANEFKTKFPVLDTTNVPDATTVELFANEIIDDKLATFMTFPIEANGKLNLKQIIKSCKELVSIVNEMGFDSVKIPSFGYKFSSKVWITIEQNIVKILDDRFEVYEYTIEEDEDAKVYSIEEKEAVGMKANSRDINGKFALIIDGTTYVNYAKVEEECNKVIKKYGKERVLIITREGYGACKHAYDFAIANDVKYIKVVAKQDNTAPATRVAVRLADLACKYDKKSVLVFTSEKAPRPGSALLFYNIAKEYELEPNRIEC